MYFIINEDFEYPGVKIPKGILLLRLILKDNFS